MKISGSNHRNLTLIDGFSDSAHIALSPDEEFIAFESRRPTNADLRDIYVISVDGEAKYLEQITATGSESFWPTWGPE